MLAPRGALKRDLALNASRVIKRVESTAEGRPRASKYRVYFRRMSAISRSNHDLVAKLVPGGVHSLAHVDDQELLRNTRRLVGKSNQLFAGLLLHLAEVEARGLHRTARAPASTPTASTSCDFLKTRPRVAPAQRGS